MHTQQHERLLRPGDVPAGSAFLAAWRRPSGAAAVGRHHRAFSMAATSAPAADEVEDGEASEDDCVDCLAYARFNSIYDSANSKFGGSGIDFDEID